MKLVKNGAGTFIGVELSRRNLESLLAKLNGHPPNSACTLGAPGGSFFYVKAVENGIHYSEREAGIIHPDTEAAIE